MLYDGALYCGSCSCGCPVVSLDSTTGMVVINDPSKPENGEYRMTQVEYNTLLTNAKPIV